MSGGSCQADRRAPVASTAKAIGCAALALLTALGDRLTFHSYPGLAHTISEQELRDVRAFLDDRCARS